MFCGFPLGAVIGGMVSTQLIPSFGWTSVFIVGGALPLLLVPNHRGDLARIDSIPRIDEKRQDPNRGYSAAHGTRSVVERTGGDEHRKEACANLRALRFGPGGGHAPDLGDALC